MRGNNAKLADAIAAGLTITDAARLAEMSTRTAQRRLADPAVVRLVDARRAELVEQERAEVQGLRSLALGRVRELMQSANEQTACRAAALALKVSYQVSLADLYCEVLEMRRQVLDVEAALAGDSDDELLSDDDA